MPSTNYFESSFPGYAHGKIGGMSNGHMERLRGQIESQYVEYPTGSGGSFGEILCWEIHANGMTFAWLAAKWGISLAMLGELIWDHCKRLEDEPRVNHQYHP